jgi:hypothetical protein
VVNDDICGLLNLMKMLFSYLLYGAFVWMTAACTQMPSGEKLPATEQLPIDEQLPTGDETRKLIPVGPLPDELTENSGMVMIGPDDYVGLNDSGHDAELFVFSMHRKSGTRKVKVTNATNVDWEEITTDEQYIYIGDTGNNDGHRRDICIYRVRIDDVKKKSEVTADKLSFRYEDQTSFKASNKHNFDCEALVCVEDSLFMFSKNRGDLRTNVYGILKVPGEQVAVHRGSFEANGLITGAAFRTKYGPRELALVGYTNKKHGYMPFMIHFTDVPGNEFFKSPSRRIEFETSNQIESVIFRDAITAYLTNEEEHGEHGLIFKVMLNE